MAPSLTDGGSWLVFDPLARLLTRPSCCCGGCAGRGQAVADGGLLCVTCTDMAVLNGTHPEVGHRRQDHDHCRTRPARQPAPMRLISQSNDAIHELPHRLLVPPLGPDPPPSLPPASFPFFQACYAKYRGVPTKGRYMHEMSVRLVLAAIEAQANRYKRYIQPVLGVAVDFYLRVFVRVYTSPAEVSSQTDSSDDHRLLTTTRALHAEPTPALLVLQVKNSILKQSYVYQSIGCPSFHLQPLGRMSGGSNYTATLGFACPPTCPETGKAFKVRVIGGGSHLSYCGWQPLLFLPASKLRSCTRPLSYSFVPALACGPMHASSIRWAAPCGLRPSTTWSGCWRPPTGSRRPQGQTLCPPRTGERAAAATHSTVGRRLVHGGWGEPRTTAWRRTLLRCLAAAPPHDALVCM